MWYKRDYSGIKFSIVLYCNPYLAGNLIILNEKQCLFIYLLPIIDGMYFFICNKNKK